MYTKNKKFFSKYTIESCYWAGFIAADGCIRPKISTVIIELATKDHIQLEKFKKSIEYDGNIKTNNRTTSFGISNSSKIEISGVKDWIQDLNEKFNITTNKSLTLKPPIKIKKNSHKAAFIKGYIDGDGSISCYKYKRKDRQNISSMLEIRILGTYEMLSWIKQTISEFGIINNAQVIEQNNIYKYKLSSRNSIELSNYLNKYCKLGLDRKWGKVSEYINMTKGIV